MDDSPSTAFPTSPPRSTMASLVAWLVVSLVATTALSLAAAHAPPRIRLIGLFSVGFGWLIGWLVVWLAANVDAKPNRILMGFVAAILTFGGLVGFTFESIRIEESLRPKSSREELALRLIEEMKTKSNDALSEPIDASKLALFRSYLARRIRQLGEWKSPWPELLWTFELAASVSASFWMSYRIAPKDSEAIEDPKLVQP